jgi:NAD(P)-dependent dehydrogenase (short-subunit alcohol dehydrogenase family)
MDRLKGKYALVVGAGQTPGTTIGNGRAVAVRFAQEGASVFAVDRDLARATATADAINQEGGHCVPFAADITVEADIVRMVQACMKEFGRIDILHNNVGVAGAAGDAPVASISAEVFDQIHAINLRGMVMTCKHVLPIFESQKSGVIINVGSLAAVTVYKNIAYKTSKAGVMALTHNIATNYAPHGVRCNTILPGLVDTPMAIEARASGDDASRAKVREVRDAMVPLRGKMGSAWDIANAALFLASDEASFVTGVDLAVDGGLMAMRG